jgi:DNA-directed RNA polymerase specialized sigma24 family protein
VSTRDTTSTESVSDAVQLAILALLVEDREARLAQRPDATKTEVILAACGLDAATISKLVRKQASSVRTVLSRERATGKSSTPSDSNG